MLRAIARSFTFPRAASNNSITANTASTTDTAPPRSRKYRSRSRPRCDQASLVTATVDSVPCSTLAVQEHPSTCRTSADDSYQPDLPTIIPSSGCKACQNSEASVQKSPIFPGSQPIQRVDLQRPPNPNPTSNYTALEAARIPELIVVSAPSPPLDHPHSNAASIEMLRKVWVKRPGASATRVEVREDDLVDNVRDVILQKYANSLGRSIDSPDVTLKIISREQANRNVPAERTLSPEEPIGRTLDTYYPGGQSIDDALLIDVPTRRTPRPSPRAGNHLHYYPHDDFRPGDGARDYFPPMPLHSPRMGHAQPVHSMSILSTGQPPPLPSPGGHNTRRQARPRYGRQHTSSPTIIHTTQTQHPNGIDTKSQMNGGPSQQTSTIPTPPPQSDHKGLITPPNRTSSPHPARNKKKKLNAAASLNGDPPPPSKPASAQLLDGRVPPINVLIVEDNVINLRLLEQFMRRLKVRWQTAMNGREAVDKWREGGFHLVLMDIQLPIMSGLEATKEIRRLEGANGIGLSIFGDTSPEEKGSNGHLNAEDTLSDRNLFKSPVIIVALTASSLQSDRHEALAVGCNDFLTKALIDFDGWRKWKEIEAKKNEIDPKIREQQEKEEKAKAKAALRAAMSRPPPLSSDRAGNASTDSSAPTTNGTGSNTATSQNGPPTSMGQGRRAHNNSRSGVSLGSLPATIEVDEKA